MRIRFWGTRGSLPVALTAPQLRQKLVDTLRASRGRDLSSDAAIGEFVDALPFATRGTYGGHSPCVQVELEDPDQYLVCDMGSGLRPFGQAVTKARGGKPATYHVLVSHVHWDHIMGLPFFAPAWMPGNRIVFHGCHRGIESALRRQMDEPSFPVPMTGFRATLEYARLRPGEPADVAGTRVTAKRQHHSGDSYGFRIELGGRSVVYTTDTEHKMEDPAQIEGFAEFFREADLVIFDSMYSLADALSVKEDWGHSSNVVAVELCQLARARRLALFHHEPVLDDTGIETLLAETRRYERITRTDHAVEVLAAYDGLEIGL